MSIKWNPDIKKYKFGQILGEGYYGKVYYLNETKVLKITKMKESQNQLIEKEKYDNLEKLQKKYSFINKILELYIDDNFIYEVQEKVDDTIDSYVQKAPQTLKKQILNQTIDFIKKVNKCICHNDLHVGNIGIKNGQLCLIDNSSIEDYSGCKIDWYLILSNVILSFIGEPTKNVSKYLYPPYKKLGQRVNKMLQQKEFKEIWDQLDKYPILARQKVLLLIQDFDQKKHKPFLTKQYIKLWQLVSQFKIEEFQNYFNKLMDVVYK